MRWFRFRLHTLFIVMTIVAFAVFGMERWRTTRLGYFLDRFNEFSQAGQWEQAAEVSALTLQRFPEHKVGKELVQFSALALHEKGGSNRIESPLPKGSVCKFCGRRCEYPLDFEPEQDVGNRFRTNRPQTRTLVAPTIIGSRPFTISQKFPSTAPSPPHSIPPAE